MSPVLWSPRVCAWDERSARSRVPTSTPAGGQGLKKEHSHEILIDSVRYRNAMWNFPFILSLGEKKSQSTLVVTVLFFVGKRKIKRDSVTDCFLRRSCILEWDQGNAWRLSPGRLGSCHCFKKRRFPQYAHVWRESGHDDSVTPTVLAL